MHLGISTKSDGSMSPLRDRENRARYFQPLFDAQKIIAPGLVHGTNVTLVDQHSPDFIPDTDGLVTQTKNIVLTVTVADCYPVYFFDPHQESIGLAHIGWQGAAKNIVREMIAQFEALGSRQGEIGVTIGPGICATDYTIPKERRNFFSTYPEALREVGEDWHLDIKKVIVAQLVANGVSNRTDQQECTFELPERYFSYRRDRPARVEPQVAWITLG